MAGGMNRSWFWRDVQESLLTRPLKTALTFVSVAIGMLALCMLLAILAGLQERARSQIAEIGADVIMIEHPPGPDRWLNPESLIRLEQLAPGALASGVRMYSLNEDALLGSVTVLATDAHHPAVRGWRLATGRWLDVRDLSARAPYAVISAGLAERLHLQPGDPLIVRETALQVIGIISNVREALLLLPVTAPAWWNIESQTLITYDRVYVKKPAEMEIDYVVTRLQRDFESDQRRHGAALSVVTPETLIASTRNMMRTIRMVYGSVAGLCLALGGVTLFSLMMVSIQQRVAEIGLRMAIGGSWRDIFLLFLCEGIITTCAAGAVGMLSGIGLLFLARETMALPAAWTWPVFVVPLIASMLLGLIFSWYPAHTAASLTPADALRNE